MKLTKKIFSTIAATVLALSMMVGTAMAATNKLPFDYGEAAGFATNNDVWVKLAGGDNNSEGLVRVSVAKNCRSVDVTIEGKCSFDAEICSNTASGWKSNDLGAQTVDGTLVLSIPANAADSDYCECIVNLKNKTAGALSVTKMDFKDADGNIFYTFPVPVETPAEEAPAADATLPKTGVVSTAVILGLGACTFGAGATLLKNKED